MSDWTLDDIPWDKFDASAVDPETVKLVKAACMVEYNGADYATYLCNVFDGDEEFCDAARQWAAEEVRHGRALRRWAEIADPGFDFDDSFQRFTEGYKLPLEATRSVRGSRTGELIARCVVEVGTSSYYSALRDGVAEPVLADICGRIAGDEFRHYKLFLGHMRRYQARERLGLPRRLWIAFGRLIESEDDELAFAYYCGAYHRGAGGAAPYSRRRSIRAYARRALPFYRFGHVQRGLGMVFKAVGMDPRGGIGRSIVGWILASTVRLAWRVMQYRARQLDRAAA